MPADVVWEAEIPGVLPDVERVAELLLELVDLADAELSIVLVDDARITILNRDYRDRERPTDVLSFPQSDGSVPHGGVLAGNAIPLTGEVDSEALSSPAPPQSRGPFSGSELPHVSEGGDGAISEGVGDSAFSWFTEPGSTLGDVVISVDTARRQAQAGGWDLAAELTRLLLHGFLHLLGYDHEVGAKAARVMRLAEERLASELTGRGIPCASMLASAEEAGENL